MNSKEIKELEEMYKEFWELEEETAHKFRLYKIAMNSYKGIKSKVSQLKNKILIFRDK